MDIMDRMASMVETYFIGGSPCSGKSTIAEMLVEKYDFRYYKLDDHLGEYIEKGANEGYEPYKKIASMTIDEIWFRNPLEQCDEEIAIYQIMFSYAISDISNLFEGKPIIAEGAGFMPRLMKKIGVDASHYACIVPSKAFQTKEFSQRTWIRDYLSSCSDFDRAFSNWMERDHIFARTVFDEARNLGYFSTIVDGRHGVDEIYTSIEQLFRLCP